MNTEELIKLAVNALEDLKGNDINQLDVTGLTDMTDHMIFVSGTSSRHVKSLAQNLVTSSKEAGVQPVGVEGEDSGEWVLVDLGDVLVHVMLPEMREFYALEKLWSGAEASEQSE